MDLLVPTQAEPDVLRIGHHHQGRVSFRDVIAVRTKDVYVYDDLKFMPNCSHAGPTDVPRVSGFGMFHRNT